MKLITLLLVITTSLYGQSKIEIAKELQKQYKIIANNVYKILRNRIIENNSTSIC